MVKMSPRLFVSAIQRNGGRRVVIGFPDFLPRATTKMGAAGVFRHSFPRRFLPNKREIFMKDESIAMRRTLAERELNRARCQLQHLSTLTDSELCASGLRNR